MKNTRERNRGMDRPNWGKDPFTKFRKQRGNPQIGQPPGLIPKKGYPIFGLALLALQDAHISQNIYQEDGITIMVQ